MRAFANKEFAEAQSDFKQLMARKDGPYVEDAYFYNAESYIRRLLWNQAISAFDQFIAKYPSDLLRVQMALHEKTFAYFMLEDCTKASEILKEFNEKGIPAFASKPASVLVSQCWERVKSKAR